MMQAELERLCSALPSLEEATNQDEQARAALRIVVAEALVASPGGPVFVLPTHCPNCGVEAVSLRTPYCGDACKEEAAFVRQTRDSLISGAINEPERQVALGEKLWRLLGGGYPRRLSLAPARAIAKALEREQGRCELCGSPATTASHIGSG
jgi:hypothetical protein